ncbi:MAG: hypothetical protein J5998_14205, partial [Clostridia bacterium]|nr:hypothetical protein [Clostridia bacterium]
MSVKTAPMITHPNGKKTGGFLKLQKNNRLPSRFILSYIHDDTEHSFQSLNVTVEEPQEFGRRTGISQQAVSERRPRILYWQNKKYSTSLCDVL